MYSNLFVNSLKTTKSAQGYVLVSRDDLTKILKYGETTLGFNRYTKKYLNDVVPGGADMIMLKQGSKLEMHNWQHEQILEYTRLNGERPPLNKSDW